jgi:hypothetical protein
MKFPLWLLRLLPMWDYVCPRCQQDVPKNSHKCPHCGERYPMPLKLPPSVLKDKKLLEDYVHKHIFPTVSPVHRAYLSQFFTELFSDGFESGDFSEWTSTTTEGSATITVDNAYAHHGSYAAKVYLDGFSDDANAEKTLSTETEGWARCYFYISQFTGYNIYRACTLLGFSDSGVHLAVIQLKANDPDDPIIGIIFWDDATYTQGADSSTSITKEEWHCAEVHWRKSPFLIEVWLDGVQLDDLTQTGYSTAHDINSVVIGNTSRGFGTVEQTEATYYVDCVAVADAYIGVEAGEQSLVEVTDMLSLSDAVLNHKTFSITDSIGATDAMLGNKLPLIAADAISLADGVFVHKVLRIAETVNLVEVVGVGVGGVMKTRLFLMLGDLAVQLTGD